MGGAHLHALDRRWEELTHTGSQMGGAHLNTLDHGWEELIYTHWITDGRNSHTLDHRWEELTYTHCVPHTLDLGWEELTYTQWITDGRNSLTHIGSQMGGAHLHTLDHRCEELSYRHWIIDGRSSLTRTGSQMGGAHLHTLDHRWEELTYTYWITDERTHTGSRIIMILEWLNQSENEHFPLVRILLYTALTICKVTKIGDHPGRYTHKTKHMWEMKSTALFSWYRGLRDGTMWTHELTWKNVDNNKTQPTMINPDHNKIWTIGSGDYRGLL